MVVLTYGTAGQHLALLDSLEDEGVPMESVVVVHNPSAPGEPDPDLPDGCELVRASHNLGYAAGMNLGIARQRDRYELILLLTHDARLRPGSLGRLLDAADASPGYGVLGPTLVHTGTDTAFSYGGITRPNGTMAHRRELPPSEDGIAACDWVDGGTMLIRSAALTRVGDFDERFWSYCEEAELCLRMTRAGFAVGVVPDAVADQSPGGAARRGPWSYLLIRNGAAYARAAAGWRGSGSLTVRAAHDIAVALARTTLRSLRLRPGPRDETWALAVGTARGIADFYRRRWGPPPPLPGVGDVSNVEPPAEDGAPPARPRILHLGPEVRGGMTTVMRSLRDSPLADEYEVEIVATHRGAGPGRRLGVFAAAMFRLLGWSLTSRGRIVQVHATVRGSSYRKAVCVLLARALRRRVVLHVHSGPLDIAEMRRGIGPVRARLLGSMYRAADVVLAVSAASAAALEAAYPVTGVRVVPNAAPTLADRPRRAGGGSPIAVFLGGFANPVKGGAELLEALALPSAKGLEVVLAGPGEPPRRLGQLQGEGWPLSWRGWLEDAERDALLREAEIFVLPSTSEGLPMALLEAMAYGLAIVATDVGGVPDVLSDGRDALLVPAGDTERLAVALGLLAGDAELRARLGAAATESAADLNAEQVWGRLDAIYRELLSG